MFTWLVSLPLILGIAGDIEGVPDAAEPLPENAQTFDLPRGEDVPIHLDSGWHDNAAGRAKTTFTDLVRVDDARWIRLFFDDVDLQPGSRIRITSVFDGESQVLDADTLEQWNGSTAYFNGDSVLIELIAGPGTTDNRLRVDRASVELGAPEGGLCGICNGDDREPSNVQWSGRLMPTGCSASVYNTESCLVSAGHCTGSADVVQFNVPNSAFNCSPQHPPIADQFPVNQIQSQNSGAGGDWAVMTTGTNNQNQTIYERYGVFMPLADSIPSTGSFVEAWTYGASESCTLNQTQQYSEGHVTAVFSSPPVLRADVDVTFGSSGGALVHNGAIVGVITHCDDTCNNGNIAQRIDTNAFANAIENLCPPDPPQPPDHNTCDQAQLVSDGQYEFDTTLATTDGPNEPNECDFANYTQIDHDVWYEYTATCTGELTASLCGSEYLSKIAVYGSSCPSGSNEALTCDLASCPGTARSEATLNVVEGESYLIRVGGHSGSAGLGTLTLSCEPGPDCPADLTGDGSIGGADLGVLLSAWGDCSDPGDCPADLTGDGSVGGADLGVLLSEWGNCD